MGHHHHHHNNACPGKLLSETTLLTTSYYDTSPINTPLDPEPSMGPVTPSPSGDTDPNPLLPVNDQVLTNSTGEKVSVDETASLSFLGFLRKTIKPYVGSMSFTDNERHHIMLESDRNDVASDRPVVVPVEIYSLLDSYFEVTSGLLDLFTADEIDILLAERASPRGAMLELPVRRDDIAAVDVALAIGAQVRESSDKSTQLARSYFYGARQIAFEGMLACQSLGTVRLFLLLAFYMLGACDRNAASMYLGVAAKAAVVLGLHQPATYRSLQEGEHNTRLRTWNSLRNIDILTSFILGRPKSLPTVKHNINQIEMASEDSQSAFSAILNGCSLLEDIVNKLSKGNMLHVPTAEGLLEQLRNCSRALPQTLRQFTFASDDRASLDPANRQLLSGNMHVSCVYYFAVILITRPFLIAYLMSRLRGRAPDQLISNPDEASDVNIKNNKVSKLAQVCVSSAIYMADMCQKAKASNFTFGNLCLLKAWIFGAGLILGFSMFAGEPRKDIEDSFEDVVEILDDIAATSPQAQLYSEILTNFSESINKYHHRVSGEVRHAVQHYIDQILVFDSPRNAGDVSQYHTLLSSEDANTNLDEQFPSAPINAHRNTYSSDMYSSVEGMHSQVDMAEYGDITEN
ncbi:hypothetical protein B7463_g5879, partial [Scytalidium lignicola]